MNKYIKKILCIVLTVSFAFSLVSCSNGKADKGVIKSFFTDTSKVSFSYDYTQLKDKNAIKLNHGEMVWFRETDFKALLKAEAHIAILLFSKICIL